MVIRIDGFKCSVPFLGFFGPCRLTFCFYREFIENDVVQFAKENPHVALYLKPRRNRSPVVVAEYCKYPKTFL